MPQLPTNVVPAPKIKKATMTTHLNYYPVNVCSLVLGVDKKIIVLWPHYILRLSANICAVDHVICKIIVFKMSSKESNPQTQWKCAVQ